MLPFLELCKKKNASGQVDQFENIIKPFQSGVWIGVSISLLLVIGFMTLTYVFGFRFGFIKKFKDIVL